MSLFRIPMRLVGRTEDGTEDSWGTPVITETRTDIYGYWWERKAFDADDGGTVTVGVYRVAFLAPSGLPQSIDAIEFEMNGRIESFEILGPPEERFSMVSGGKPHHYECLVKRAAA